jgi:hypothetical protein
MVLVAKVDHNEYFNMATNTLIIIIIILFILTISYCSGFLNGMKM